MEQSDIIPVLEGFKIINSAEGLIVLNPPVVKVNEETTRDWIVVSINLTHFKGEISCQFTYTNGDCLGEWKENHLMSETIEECTWCGSKNIGRKPSEFSYGSSKQQKIKKLVI